jgi:hypothetical protein
MGQQNFTLQPLRYLHYTGTGIYFKCIAPAFIFRLHVLRVLEVAATPTGLQERIGILFCLYSRYIFRQQSLMKYFILCQPFHIIYGDCR